MANADSTITPELLHELFEYRDGQLYWKVSRQRVQRDRGPAGAIVKRGRGHGYVRIGINKNIYYAHRLIWMLHKGYMPACIDHVNGIRHDNRIENLREVTPQENSFNAKTKCTNTSGVKGVSWDRKNQKWQTYITFNGKQTGLGRFSDIEEAEAVVRAARAKYHGEFARHK